MFNITFWKKILPEFWYHKERIAGEKGQQYIFRKKWKFLIHATCILTLLPLAISTFFFYKNNENETLTDLLAETEVLTKGTAVDVKIFLDQYLTILRIIATQYKLDSLKNEVVLKSIFKNIEKSNIRFSTFYISDKNGRRIGHNPEKPFLENDTIDLSLINLKQEYFLGRNIPKSGIPQIILGLRLDQDNKEPFFLVGAIDSRAVELFLKRLKFKDIVEIYLIDDNEVLLTPSEYLGIIGKKAIYPNLTDLSLSEVIRNPHKNQKGGDFLFSGISQIGTTDMRIGILFSNNSFEAFMSRIRAHIFIMASLSVLFVLITLLFLVTWVVQVLYRADKIRQSYLRKAARSSKMASIGQLAAGVAHEINNPLAIINEKAGLLQDFFTFLDEYKNDARIADAVGSIINAVHRAGTITHRLLGFARETDSSIQSINLNNTVYEVLGFIQKETEYKSIAVNVYVPDHMPEIKTDHGKLQQILLNLMINAVAALKQKGMIIISAKSNAQNRSIEIIIKDNGCGISKEHQKKIFEPFFSTKTKIGGTGLGLSLTYGLIRDLHGTLELESSVGVGTTFKITLPYEILEEE